MESKKKNNTKYIMVINIQISFIIALLALIMIYMIEGRC